MAKFKILDDGDSFYTVKEVPIFELHTDRGFPCDEEWMKAAINQHHSFRDQGYRPPIIIGHNVKGVEKEAVGFLDNLVLKGKQLYADLVRIPKEVKEKIVRNAFPSRSVEVLPQSKRILTLALLGGTTPHFPLAQLAYGTDSNETHLWFRSPDMLTMTDDEKKELYSLVGEAVAKAVPVAIQQHFKDNGEDDSVEYIHPVTGQVYTIPAALAAVLAKGKTALGAAGTVAGKAAGTARKFVKRHPLASVGGAAAQGALVGRATKREYAAQGYAVNEETGEVYYDGRPLGMIVTYEDLQEAGMGVPTAPKRPDALPVIEGGDPDLTISAGDVGEGTGTEDDMLTDIPEIEGDNIQPLDREDSDQFTINTRLAQENYDLHQRLAVVEKANALVTHGRQAEEYTKWLEEQQRLGVPVGNVEQQVTFMMTLTPKQVEVHKSLLLTQPKIAFERAEHTVNFAGAASVDIKQEYAQNRETYQALGVTDKDLKWAGFVRVNRAVGEK